MDGCAMEGLTLKRTKRKATPEKSGVMPARLFVA
jgi:hypothetical protein